MPKYRKKPVMIEAFQWTGDREQTEDPKWINKAVEEGKVYFINANTDKVHMAIETLEGEMYARRGDFIIQGVNGEIYPCKPDIFEKTYDLVE
ncbi:hypothetical protein ACOSZF_20905 [Cytobacillus firmus]|uniref:hypothetical protein n=1 Tax=Cytobacillus firmus TaxID=1399 RepID=UPI003BA0EE35